MYLLCHENPLDRYNTHQQVADLPPNEIIEYRRKEMKKKINQKGKNTHSYSK